MTTTDRWVFVALVLALGMRTASRALDRLLGPILQQVEDPYGIG